MVPHPFRLPAALLAAWVFLPGAASAQQSPATAGADPAASAAVALAEALAAPTAARVTAADSGAVVLDAATDPAGSHRIAAAPRQAFAVVLQYPAAMAGEEIVADPVDGGRIDGRPFRKLKVGADGRLLFTFTAGTNLGAYAVELRSDRGAATTLEFRVKAAPRAN